MSSRLPAPSSLSRTCAVLAAVAGALYFIARSTGSGWDIVMLCLIVAVLVVGAIWPGITLIGVGATAEAPQDATVGRPLPIQVRLTGRARGLRLRVSIDPHSTCPWTRADAPSAGEIRVTPERRGVFQQVVVDVRSASPLGLVGWRRRIRVSLVRPIEVAPKVIAVKYDPVRGADHIARARPRASASGQEITRGVREYVDGDPIRLVHWPATARTGAVMVRELEGPQRPRLVVVVDLVGPYADVEIAASRASGLAIAALASGTVVDLATVEPTGTRTGAVQSPVEVGRRLARAVSGAPTTGPIAPGVDVRHVRAGSTE